MKVSLSTARTLAAVGGAAALGLGALTWSTGGRRAPDVPTPSNVVVAPSVGAEATAPSLQTPIPGANVRSVSGDPCEETTSASRRRAAEGLVAIVAQALRAGGDRENFDALVGAVADELGRASVDHVRAVGRAGSALLTQLAAGEVLRRMTVAGTPAPIPRHLVEAARRRAFHSPLGLEGCVAARLCAAFGSRADRERMLVQLAHPDAGARSAYGRALRLVPADELFLPLAAHLETAPEEFAHGPLALLRDGLAREVPDPGQEARIRQALGALAARTTSSGLARRATSVLASIPTPGSGVELVTRFENSRPGDGDFELLAPILPHLADPLALQELVAIAGASLAGAEHRAAAERALAARGFER